MVASGYASDLDYLGDALAVQRLRCRARIIERESAGLIPRDPVAALSGAELDVDAVTRDLGASRDRLAERLAATDR